MTRMLLVRHGQSQWNAVGRWQGWADPSLSELGREQSRLAARAALDPIDAVATSDLERAADTAAILADGLGAGPVVVERRLRERHVGEWTGLTRAEIEQGWPGALSGGRADPPGGESRAELVERVLGALERLQQAYPEGNVLVVTHAGVIHAVERHLGLVAQPVPNLGGLWLEVSGEGLRPGKRLTLIDPDDVVVTVPRQL